MQLPAACLCPSGCCHDIQPIRITAWRLAVKARSMCPELPFSEKFTCTVHMYCKVKLKPQLLATFKQVTLGVAKAAQSVHGGSSACSHLK